jgi:intein/homing endonuclease
MKYINELQNIDTEEKAYLLGLFYSDGYVCSTNNNCGITLHNNDLILLEKLINVFPFFKLRNSHKNASKIDCTSKQLKKDLLFHGVLFLKSSLNRENLSLPNIDKSLINHFIRGFFDGDGSVFKQKLFNIKIEIGCTSFNLITQILKILYDNRINCNMSCSYSGNSLRTIDYYKLYTSSYRESKKFADYIYKDSSIYLERKYEKLNVVPEYNIRTRLICPLCNSNNTVFGGERNNKSRIICKDCKKRSSIITAPNISNNIGGEDELTGKLRDERLLC